MILGLLLLAQASVFAQPFDGAKVDALIESSLKAWEVPGAAVAIVQDGDVVYMKGLGLRDLGTKQPVTPDTLFAIASTTKAFCTTSIAILVDEGKMAWDDPVRKHLPWFRLSDPLANEGDTLRDIVSHRTGLSRHDVLWSGSDWGREEIIRKAGIVPLTKPFRSAYQYQNIMFTTAGEAVAKAAGTTWEEFARTRIFEPLDIRGANFSTRDALNAADHSSAHIRDRNDTVKVDSWRNVDNIGSAGEINAGVRDMSRWLRFQMGDGTVDGKRLVSKANLDETHTPQTVIRMEGAAAAQNPETNMMAYGLGWTIQDYRGHHMVSHGGSLNGFRTQVAMLPRDHWGMVILSNLGGTQMPEALRNTLADHLLGLPPARDWNAYLIADAKKQREQERARRKERDEKRHKDTRPSRDLPAYTGSYEDPAYGTARVTLEDGSLFLSWSRHKVPLEHFHFDTFSVKTDRSALAGEQVVFALDASGDVESLKTLGVVFQRTKASK